MRSDLRSKLDSVYTWIENTYRARQRKKTVAKLLKSLNGGNKKNDDKYPQYLEFWSKFGKKPSINWVRLYSKDHEDFDYRYIPDEYWYGDILPYFSNMQFRRPYEDKNFHEILFSDIKRPATVVKCIAGVLFNNKNEIIDEDEVYKLISSKPEVIIKPSVDSGMGRLIQFFEPEKDSISDLKKKLEIVGQNYIVQEIVKQHKKLSDLNPNTLNTIRVISFLFKGQVHPLSVIARMGSGSAKVDNVSAGGLQITVSKEGKFQKFAFDKKRNKFSTHPDTKIEFEGYEVPSFDKILSTIKNVHKRMPHFKIIGWDFAVDEAGEPVFIEYNVCPGSNQMTDGPTFGDLTEEVLKDVYIDKTFEHAKN